MNDQVKDDAGPTADPLLKAIDEERRRMARELHDGLGQALTGVRLLAGTLSSGSEESTRQQLEGLLREAAQRTRGLCHSLEPAGEGGALADLIASVGSDLELRHQFPVQAPKDAPDTVLDKARWHLLQHALVEAVESVGRVRDIERVAFSASLTPKGK
ncbi:MAG: histidine kinase, partial [Pseudomonadota bacterium]